MIENVNDERDRLRQCVVAALMLQRLLPFASALDPAQGRAAEEVMADLVEWLRQLQEEAGQLQFV